ncbi:ABC transporter permease [Nakamurella endophytica]|uniref:Autoinducer 2 import system permease protein LsrD n=1 Tax=Nakamurella endophytica TaxID=1748367 RepID=A0A917SS82_9ACTN|nr:ABC transporter permease [Nakamurella endophytica]GGL94820.1 ABC transporter permease [Nakamurella endophytica]
MTAEVGTARPARRVTGEQLSRYVPVALVPLLFLAGVVTIEGYASRSSVVSLLVLSSFLGLASMGQTLTVIVGGIDLSVPSVIGLANVLVTSLYGDGWSFWTACLLILGFAVLIGAVNAVASLVLKVNPIITTLGTGLIVLGGVLSWGHASITGSVPQWLTDAVSVIGHTGPIPVPGVIVLWVVLAAGVVYLQRRTRLGREIYVTGSNPAAARLTHVRTTWVWIAVFIASAVSAAIVGVLFAGYSGAADANVGQPYLFQTITAVVVGGTSLLGGRGGYGRTLIGVLIISQLTTLLVGAGLGPSLQETMLGVLIIVLVSAYGREPGLATRI